MHLSKGKFILHHDTVNAETKIVEFNKETGEEQLLFALPMVQDFEVHLLAYIIPEMASKKCSILSSETGRTWLSGFVSGSQVNFVWLLRKLGLEGEASFGVLN
ncbi:hypothetical protein Q3G72_003666 [Acer saccharum]|nr:hypothetical protein Q3G72_003666 [Acer saccharum]